MGASQMRSAISALEACQSYAMLPVEAEFHSRIKFDGMRYGLLRPHGTKPFVPVTCLSAGRGAPRIDAWLARMTDAGYQEGKNLMMEWGLAAGQRSPKQP